MRALHAIGAALLVTWATPGTSHAEAAAKAGAALSAPAASCPCPRPHRYIRHARWHRRYVRPGRLAAALPPPWPAYNPPMPSPEDSAYARLMVQYMHAREFDGEYLLAPDRLPTFPVPGDPHFVVAAGGGVYEFDMMAGGYVQLAQGDAQRALAALASPR